MWSASKGVNSRSAPDRHCMWCLVLMNARRILKSTLLETTMTDTYLNVIAKDFLESVKNTSSLRTILWSVDVELRTRLKHQALGLPWMNEDLSAVFQILATLSPRSSNCRPQPICNIYKPVMYLDWRAHAISFYHRIQRCINCFNK